MIQHSTLRSEKHNSNAKSSSSTLLGVLKIEKKPVCTLIALRPPLSPSPACSRRWGGRVVAAGAVTSSRIQGGNPQTQKGIEVPYDEAGRWEGAVWRARPGRERPDGP